MNKECRMVTVLVLVVMFCFAVVPVAQAGWRVNTKPIWHMTEDGTSQSVTWKNHRPNRRFKIYDAGTPEDTSDDLVLDQETGLVWQRQPSAVDRSWMEACDDCYNDRSGDKRGWRLPTAAELASLLGSEEDVDGLFTPAGNPFIDVRGDKEYWTSTLGLAPPECPYFSSMCTSAWGVHFNTGQLVVIVAEDGAGNVQYRGVWCVRGGQESIQ